MNVMRTAATMLAATVLASAPAAAQANPAHEATVRALFDGPWSNGSFERLGTMVTPDLVFHFRGRPMPMPEDEFKGMVAQWRTIFPDLKFTIEDMVSSGDRVAARMTFTGTHSAPAWGLEPTGRKVSVTMMGFFRFANGRIVEMWEDFDDHGMRQQVRQPAGGGN